MKVRNATRVRD